MDSETSENTDTISADLVTNVFSTLPSPSLANLSRFEYGLYRTYAFLIPGSRQMLPFSLALSIIRFFQFFSIICIFLIYDAFHLAPSSDLLISSDDNSSSLTLFQFLYFFISFRIDVRDENLVDVHYYVAIIFISTLSIIAFIYMMIAGLYNKVPQVGMQCLYVALLVDVPQTLLYVLVYQFSNIFLHLFTKQSTLPIYQTAVLFICCIFFYWMVDLSSKTIFQSIYYQKGARIYHPQIFENYNIMIAVLLCLNCFRHLLSDDKNYRVFSLILYILVGIYFISAGLLRLSITANGIAFDFSMGTSFLSAAIYNILRVNNILPNTELYLFINAWVFLCTYIISYLLVNSYSQFVIEQIKTEKFRFDSKERVGNYKLMYYAMIAFSEALPCAIDLSFLDQALNFKRPNWVYYGLLRYAFLIDSENPKVIQLLERISRRQTLSATNHFIDLEKRFYDYSNLTSDLPDEFENSVSELEAKIGQFQTANKAFTAKISDDPKVNYLLTDALGSMQDLITNEMMLIKRLMPNCPAVLNLYASYKSKVCGDDVSAKEWSTTANEIKKGSILFADYSHLHALDVFPKIQSKLLDFAINKRQRNEELTNKNPLANSNMGDHHQRFPPISQNRVDSRQTLLTLFGTQKSSFILYAKAVLLLLLISQLVQLFYILQTTSCANKSLQDVFDFGQKFFKTMFSYCYFVNPAMYLIYNMSNTNTISIKDVRENATIYQTDCYDLSTRYKVLSYSSERFHSSFDWFPRDLFEIPTTDCKAYISIELSLTLNRLSSLFLSIFPGDNTYVYPPEFPAFLRTTQHFPSYLIQSLDMMNGSVMTFLEKHSEDIYYAAWYASVPLLFFLALSFTIPIVLYYMQRRLFGLFPHDQSKHAQSILDTFLSRDFSTFSQLSFKFYLILLFLAMTGVGSIFILRSFSEMLNNDTAKEMYVYLSNGYQSIYGSSILTTLFLKLIDQKGIYVNHTSLYETIDEAIDYFSMDSRYNSYLTLSQNSTYATAYMYLAVFLTKENSVEPNMTIMTQMRSLLSEYIIPDLISLCESSQEKMSMNVLKVMVNSGSMTIVFFLIVILLFILEYLLLLNMWRNFTSLKMMLTQLPEKFVAASEKLVELFQDQTQLSQFSEFKKSSILDLLNMPCALIDADDIIVSTNRVWLTFFNESPDYVIGHSVNDFIKTKDTAITTTSSSETTPMTANTKTSKNEVETSKMTSSNAATVKYFTKYVSKNERLVIVDERKREAEYKKRLSSLKEKVMNLKAVIMPQRFIRIKDKETTINVPFVITCSIVMSPTRTDDLNPDEWITDIKELEQWISERCKCSKDVDILRGSGRDLLLLFGVNERDDKYLLAVSAMTILIDLMRWGVEYEWKSGGIDLCIIVSSGSNAVFKIINDDPSSMIEMLGSTFEKQMSLREKVELYSIVCDKETYNLIEECKLGIGFEQLDEDTFIFSLDYVPDTGLERSPSSY